MVAVLTVDSIRASLGDFQSRELPDADGLTRAAVAAVLRPGEDGAELLFIRRAEDPRDPWSGHMAFPGGRVDPDDSDPLGAAMRETREEVGLELGTVGERIGRLSDVAAVGRGRPMSMIITPFVFAVGENPCLVPNDEVAAVVWVPMAFLADRGNRSRYPYRRGDLRIELPCYRYEEHVIWGMTFGMVDELLSLVTPS